MSAPTGTGIKIVGAERISGYAILKIGTNADSREFARLTAADEAQENKLKALRAGAKFKAICDLAFSSGSKYMSFQDCVFK